MTLPKQWLIYLFAIFLVGAFVVSRLFNIHQSLLFFIDIGRDNNVLWDWYHTGKPPLLGPQTSALPFNQSSVYFYVLFPMAVATHFSPFSTIYSVVVFYSVIFLGLLVCLRRHQDLQRSLLIVWLLVLIHPQFVIQNRFVWNPSFVGPMIVISTISFLRLQKQWSWRWYSALVVSLGAAVSFNYSAAPTFLAFLVGSFVYFRLRFVKILLGTTVAGVALNVTTVIFEIRHGFPLTKMVLYQPKLAQTETGLIPKLRDISRFGMMMPTTDWSFVAVIGGIVACEVAWFWFLAQDFGSQRANQFKTVASLLVISLIFTFLIPVSLLSHYIFGFVVLWFFVISFLPSKIMWTVIVVLALVWLRPSQVNSYLQPAQRTVAQMESCFQTVCRDIKEPMYASVQAGFHPFHAGQEDRFLMQRNGCTVPTLDEQPNAAKLMAVVADGSTYEHGKTAYNELTQFGPSQQIKEYNCQANFQVYILQR